MSEKLSARIGKVARKASAKAPKGIGKAPKMPDVDGVTMAQGPNPKKGVRPTFSKGGTAKKGY